MARIARQVVPIYEIKLEDNFTLGPNLLIYNNRTLATEGRRNTKNLVRLFL